MAFMQRAVAAVVWHQELELSRMNRTSTFGVAGRAVKAGRIRGYIDR